MHILYTFAVSQPFNCFVRSVYCFVNTLQYYTSCGIVARVSGIGVARIFDWGGPKSSKIRLASPKLRVIFQPKSDIRTIFSPKIR